MEMSIIFAPLRILFLAKTKFDAISSWLMKRRALKMMNERNQEVNTSIGCGVTECKYNRSGDYCTLRKIHVGNTCSCDAESCTCCDSYEKK